MSIALAIAIPKVNADKLKSVLDRHARFNWRSKNEIVIIELPEGLSPEDSAMFLCDELQGHSSSDHSTVLVPNRVHINHNILSDAGYSVTNGTCISNLLHGHGLLNELKKRGLDWRTSVLAMTARYALAQISEKDIDSWLSQFEFLGNHRPVGEHLLQLLEILAPADLAESLCKDSDFKRNNLFFGFNKDKYGKSWGTVTNLVQKSCPTSPMLPFNEAIEQCNDFNEVWLVEDGLFSGRESRSVFDSLRGMRPSNRSQKVPPLRDVNKLSSTSILLRFGAVCDFGWETLHRYLVKNKLLNIHIESACAAMKFSVLADPPNNEQNNKLDQSDIDDGAFLESLRNRVNPYAFQSSRGWKDAPLEAKAKLFCEEIGQQLWSSYLNQKNFDLTSWPKERIDRCSLGMEGLGLTFAFAHSVPKATLPLFWAEGMVTIGDKRKMWRPLFPSANT